MPEVMDPGAGAFAAMGVGGAIGVVSFLAGVPGRLQGLFNIDLSLFFAYAASAIVYVVVSLMTSEKALRIDG